MKNVICTLAAGLMLINAVSANDGTTPEKGGVAMAAYKTIENNSVKLIVVNKASENTTVKIRNANGQVIYTDLIRNEEKFTRKYIFSADLQNKDYTIEVINSQGTSSQLVTL